LRRVAAAALAVVLSLIAAAPAVATSAAPGTAGQVRVMFVGDSITGNPGCWRAPVWVALTDAEWDVDMVGIRTENECGDVTNAAGEPWDPDNTGIGGITTTRMWIKLARDKVLESTQPQVIVQLLGTNDLLGGADADAILDEYTKLLELYRAYDAGIEVVIAAPPPIASGACGCDDAQAALAAALPAWAHDAATEDSTVTVADLSTGFDPATDTIDGIHPNDAGNAKLAAAWVPAIETALDAHGVVAIDDDPQPTPPAMWIVVAVLLVALAATSALVLRRRS
jgi:lysophospholipase L1-like esterase